MSQPLALFTSEDGKIHLQLKLDASQEGEPTLWLTQKQLAELYEKSAKIISEHINNIYNDGELVPEATIRKFRIVVREGTRDVERLLDHYNLDAVIDTAKTVSDFDALVKNLNNYRKAKKVIQLNCTQKLIAKLPVKQGLLPEGEALNASLEKKIINNPLSGWHANLLTLQRRYCVLLVHNQTRFPLLLIGLTKPDFAALDYHFTDALMNTLLKMDANEDQMQAAQELLAPVSIATSDDRSVQGTMNQMKGDIEHMLLYDDVNIMDCSAYKIATWLAERPCNIKGQKDCIWPKEAMLKLLEQISVDNDEPIEQISEEIKHDAIAVKYEHDNVISMIDFQLKVAKE